ncbi:MAG: helix-turn-helix domain-containing protein [Deltaproteobacteria bacterium]|nr:helix-turn-helix domain-containing protein [Deltaproteobacteria bacterium]
MKLTRTFKYKLINPSPAAQKLIKRLGECTRFVYNRALAVQLERLNNREKLLTPAETAARLAGWKREMSAGQPREAKDLRAVWLAGDPEQVLDEALKDLDLGFRNYAARQAGLPKFRQGSGSDSVRFPDPEEFELDQAASRLRLPSLGWLRYVSRRPASGVLQCITVSAEADGFYFAVRTETDTADLLSAIRPPSGAFPVSASSPGSIAGLSEDLPA